jgi:DNA helicase-2/ATP-dependent DNA helicase PcrA
MDVVGSGARDAFPDYEGFSQEECDFRPGTRVLHPTWGEGIVLDASGSGDNARVTVRFDGDVEKRIMVRYGKLEIVSE